MAREEVKKSGDMNGNGKMRNRQIEDKCKREKRGIEGEFEGEREASLGEKRKLGFPSHHCPS